MGFKTAEVPFELNNIYRREQRRELPPVYMKRETKMLQEVVVTSSKVQFYYKGDTLVFNADAFELAEGSMLDALVRQLPGVELKEGGRIYHNGKYVDALLLNGKDFFRGDHTIMLDNLPAYTVKDIQIYDKWGDQSEFLGQHVMGDNRYVMDVKLKKEYRIGTLANVEAGLGTNSRHSAPNGQVPRIFAGVPALARLFALRFSDHSRLAAYATANNMNGDGKPGEAGSWDPQRLQGGGQLTQQQAGIDYNVEDRNSKWKAKAGGTYQINFTSLIRLQLNTGYTHNDRRRESNVFSLTPNPSPRGEGNFTGVGSGYTSEQQDYILPSPLGEGLGVRLPTLGFPVTLVRQKLRYQRGSIDTLVTRNTMPVNIWDCFVQYTTINRKTGNAKKMILQYIATSSIPDLQNLVDMRDDTDPLNIRIGNNSLRNAINHQFSFGHQWGNANRKESSHHYWLGYTIIQNALAMGYCYDRATGVRTWQADNVNGNWNADASYQFNTAIGKKHPLRLNVSPSISYQHSVDLVDQERSTVNTLSLNNTLSLSYKLGNHSLSFKNTTLWQRFTTLNVQFAAISSQPLTLTNALTALLKLPLQMELNTDLTLYTRTGYADTRLNTTDLVWNARLTRPILKGRLLLMVDGFDILGQLDNITRIVNAQGRTETYTNVLPRYALLHMVYRFTKQPKKK